MCKLKRVVFLMTLMMGLSVPGNAGDYNAFDALGRKWGIDGPWGQAIKARRLVISRTVKDGRFRVVLYPFRTQFDPQPKDARTAWSRHPLGTEMSVLDQTPTGFQLKMGEQTDNWSFVPGSDGCSRIRLQRGAQRWDIDGHTQ